MFLLRFIRPIILTLSVIIAIYFYVTVTASIPSADLQKIRLIQVYALIAITYLYISLLVSPLYAVFPYLPWRGLMVRARRATGVSALFFALLHSSIAFFGTLGGFAGLSFLNSNYILSIGLGAIALTILLLMGLTSIDQAIRILGPNWKRLHRFVYLASLLVLIHATLLGSHFADLSQFIPKLMYSAAFLLFLLEVIRFDRYLLAKWSTAPHFGVPLAISLFVLSLGVYYFFLPSAKTKSVGLHEQHLQVAKEAQGQNITGSTDKTIPGLDGDRNKRYTVGFNAPQGVRPNEEAQLSFQVYEATNGIQVSLFKQIQEKLAHLIIVDSELNYFDHVHPMQNGSVFTIPYRFPANGRYHLYLDFQPIGGIEQQMAFTVKVGQQGEAKKATQTPDTNLSKTFGPYQVTLKPSAPLKAAAMSLGQQTITFEIADAQSKQPITNLEPYLGAFGHLVMINQQTYDYIHVHPTRLVPPKPGEQGGPTVEFTPIGIYGPFKPGTYRAWAQFQQNGQVFVADFTVTVH